MAVLEPLLTLCVMSSLAFCDNRELNINSSNKSVTCPPWKYDKYHNSSCVCGANLNNIVECSGDQSILKVLTCNCMSYSDNSDEILVGACPYLCTNSFYTYIDEKTNLSNICNHDVNQNRQGQMCGQCLDNHSPSPYSYRQKCADCSNYKHNWIKYFLIAYLPLTVFYIIVAFCRLSALSASMKAFIFYCQIMSSNSVMSLLSNYVYFAQKTPFVDSGINVVLLFKILATFYGLWNLDFFRSVYEPFCLNPRLSTVQIMSLEYAIAVYPLLLIILTYFLIKLHERFECVKLVWKPIVLIFNRFNQQWRPSNSLIEAFATFILLSSVKIINTSFDLLMPVQVHNITGKRVGFYMFYNGSMEYFGHDHLPYAVLAIFMFTTFNLVPLLLLCLYPCWCLQSFLNFLNLNSQLLRTFMDAFQGCYKFEPYDCRYWSAFYLFFRIVLLAIFAMSQSGFCTLVSGNLLILVVMMTVIIRPYRKTAYNVVDVVILLALIQFSLSAVCLPLCAYDRRYQGFVLFMLISALSVPILYLIALVVYTIVPRIWSMYCVKKLAMRVSCHDHRARQYLPIEEAEDPLLQQVAYSLESEVKDNVSYQHMSRYNSSLNN